MAPRDRTRRPSPVAPSTSEAAARESGATGGSTAGSRGGRARSSASRREGPAATPATPAAASTAPANTANIPAESQAAKDQAERDRTGKTRPGYVRRDLAATATFNGETFQAGEKREIPEAFARHLDATESALNPDISTEVNREAKFSGGDEDDSEAQGKSAQQLRKESDAAVGKHRQSDAFDPLPRPKGAKAGK